MTTNTNTSFRYLGIILPDAYVIEAVAKGKRKGKIIASFKNYDDMLRAWDQVTTAEGLVDYVPNN